MTSKLREAGYRVAHRLVRAQFLDVPQKRERLLILAVRNDLTLPFLFPKEQDYTVSLREALSGCRESEGTTYSIRKKQILELVPPGGYWRDLPPKIQKEYMKGSLHLSGGKTGMARRLSWDEPSLTLTCNPAQKQTERCHPKQTRPLNIAEYARVQTFPDDWKFAGTVTSRYRQIGNAVPVNLGFHVGRALIAMLDGDIFADGFERSISESAVQMSLV
jgi:DNA (cytosine-5)-methyltransferase 1